MSKTPGRHVAAAAHQPLAGAPALTSCLRTQEAKPHLTREAVAPGPGQRRKDRAFALGCVRVLSATRKTTDYASAWRQVQLRSARWRRHDARDPASRPRPMVRLAAPWRPTPDRRDLLLPVG